MQSNLSHTEVPVNPAINAVCVQPPYNFQSPGLSMKNHSGVSGVDIQPPGGECYSAVSPVASYPALVSPSTGSGIQGPTITISAILRWQCIYHVYRWSRFQATWIPVPIYSTSQHAS